ncbi:MAG: UDP-N-acetylglucosamine 2-epimerase (non-hydrolyzing) [Anaerolineales bacterium]|nr:UDP-N-acetylglucosamine 2-epimerase (non-hydrolyzing) [Anaerolineae bacterium]PWB68781.1 MAG: UDP-N-acetylglucosamine 2-epimerase (non-hydrolyzing) [Anaerolineales bacterium]
MKVVTVVGARPQFIKAAPVSKALRKAGHTEFLLHTGQHYDHGMSQVFFEGLGLPAPDINLDVRSGEHGAQTGRMLEGIEAVLLAEKPDWVVVYGDTNSTLAGALAAVKIHIPLAHVEAGLRSHNRRMPEEHNRILTDHCADLLLCPTKTAVENLTKEGLTRGVHEVGDPMYDAVLMFSQKAKERSNIVKKLGLQRGCYILVTIHRAYNTDDPAALKTILSVLQAVKETIVFPVHPRTLQKLKEYDLESSIQKNLFLIDPVDYLDMLMLEQNARMILTDSGGIQKEAYFFAVPCLTLRPETEWVETIQSGWNLLVGIDLEKILGGLKHTFPLADRQPELFGNGHSAATIVRLLGS